MTDSNLDGTGSSGLSVVSDGERAPVGVTALSALGIVAYGLAGLALYALLGAKLPFWMLILSGVALFLFPTIFLVILFRSAGRRDQEPPAETEMLDLLTRSYDTSGAARVMFGPQNHLVYANQPFVDLVRARSGSTAGTAVEVLRESSSSLIDFVRVASAARKAGEASETITDVLEPGTPGALVEATAVPGKNGFVTLRVSPLPAAPRAVAGAEAGADAGAEERADLSGAAAAADVSDAEQRALRIFENAPVGIAMLTPSGEFTLGNRAFQDMMGRPLSAMRGAAFIDMVSAESQEQVTARVAAIMAGERPDTPIEIVPADRPETVLSVYANMVGAETGDGTVILHCLDSTAQRNLELQFSQSQKMQAVGQLAGGIAHDFNNLLTAMIGFCDLVLLRHRPGEQSFADIMQIKQNANRAADLVRQLLAFSRQQTLKPKTLHMTDVLSDLSHLLKRLVGANVELNVMHGRDLGPVHADRGQLEQVIINLVVNARDAMPDGGAVEIRTRNFRNAAPTKMGAEMMPAGEWTVIDVVDHGVGIPAANLDRIFEPFFSTKDVGSGTGLGLSTVYGIVKQFDGHIAVESAPGQGTTFSVFLPRHAVEEAAETVAPALTSAPPARDLTGAGTVLLVEDEDPVRLFGARALRNKGYNVVEAATGQAALEVLEASEHPIDLIVTDIMMPQMDGTVLIKHVRERWPDVGIICISGYAEDTFRQKLNDAGDVHFLSKPFSLDQLAGMVKDVMGARPLPEFSVETRAATASSSL